MKDLYDEWINPPKILKDIVVSSPDSLQGSEQQAINLLHKYQNQFLAVLKSQSKKLLDALAFSN
jgi:hypothetical protein